MGDDGFRVEVIGHATLRVRHDGKTLLTDPWLVDPIVCNSTFHYPPLVHELDTLARETDAIYVSHVHPDHFDPVTLARFPKHIPIYIGEYRLKGFRDSVAALGFTVVEVPFQQVTPVEGTAFEVAIIEHDYDENAAYDSALVVRAPEFTAFANNDCFMTAAKYAWVAERFDVDYAFLGYSPASFYPICFELDPDEKARLLRESAERRYADFVEAASALQPAISIPSASGARFLHRSALWKNVSFNSATEAVRRLAPRGLRGETMDPGDRIDGSGRVRRASMPLDKNDELAAIERYAASVQDWVEEVAGDETEVGEDVVERFRAYMLGLWRRMKETLPEVRNYVIAYVLEGQREQRFYFDFSKGDDEIFGWGEPRRYDMRYRYPAGVLQQRLDGKIDWDELHFSNRVSIHQNNYAKPFYTMLRSESLDLG